MNWLLTYYRKEFR